MEKVRISFGRQEIEVEIEKVAEYKDIETKFTSKKKTEERREKRTREETAAGISPLPESINPVVALDPFDVLMLRQRNARIRKAMDKLSHRQQEIVEKVICEQRTKAAVAEELGIDEATVRTTLQRGLKNLKKILISHEI